MSKPVANFDLFISHSRGDKIKEAPLLNTVPSTVHTTHQSSPFSCVVSHSSYVLPLTTDTGNVMFTLLQRRDNLPLIKITLHNEGTRQRTIHLQCVLVFNPSSITTHYSGYYCNWFSMCAALKSAETRLQLFIHHNISTIKYAIILVICLMFNPSRIVLLLTIAALRYLPYCRR